MCLKMSSATPVSVLESPTGNENAPAFPMSAIIGLSVCGAFGLITIICFVWMWQFTKAKKKDLKMPQKQMDMHLGKEWTPVTTSPAISSEKISMSKHESSTRKRLEPIIGSARLRAALVNCNTALADDIVDCDGGMAAVDAGFYHQFSSSSGKGHENDVNVPVLPRSIFITDGEVERRCVTPPSAHLYRVTPSPAAQLQQKIMVGANRVHIARSERLPLNNQHRRWNQHWQAPSPASRRADDRHRYGPRIESSIDAASRAVRDVEEFLMSRPNTAGNHQISISQYSNVNMNMKPEPFAYHDSALYGTGFLAYIFFLSKLSLMGSKIDVVIQGARSCMRNSPTSFPHQVHKRNHEHGQSQRGPKHQWKMKNQWR